MRLDTPRLVLRPWEDRDRAALARILGDPQVRRFYPGTLDTAQTHAFIDRCRTALARDGFGLLCAELKPTRQCVGTIGLLKLDAALAAALPGGGDVEIGWQLEQAVWGQGLAPEGAAACLDHAFKVLGLREVVAFTYAGNAPSRRVMEKLGMSRHGAFEHPALPAGHLLRPHVLYRMASPAA